MYANCKRFLLHPNFENFTRTVKVKGNSGDYLHDFNYGLLVHNHPLFSTDNIAFSTDSMACHFTFILMTRSFIHLLLAMTPLI